MNQTLGDVQSDILLIFDEIENISPKTAASAHWRYSGHPFFTRQLCSQVHKRTSTRRPQKVSLAACQAAEQDVGSDIKGYLAEILNSLGSFYPDEYTMLEYLAKGETGTFSELATYSPTYVEHLIGYGIVVRRGDDYEFSFDAVAGAVKANLNSAKDSSLEHKRQEVGRRRNILEEEIRSFLYRSTVRLSDEAWSERFSACVSKNRKLELGPLNRRDAFSRVRSPLYFTELLRFIELSNEFNDDGTPPLSSVLAAMNVVNKYRIDAHAKGITDPEYAELIRSMELLEGAFVPP